MARLARFEDIEAWKEARKLTQETYRLTGQERWSKDVALRDQVRKAAISVMSNIAEGYDRRGDAEFRHFLAIAKGSASEVKAQLYIALDQKYIDRDAFGAAYSIAHKVCGLLGAFIRYLQEPTSRTNDSSYKSQGSRRKRPGT